MLKSQNIYTEHIFKKIRMNEIFHKNSSQQFISISFIWKFKALMKTWREYPPKEIFDFNKINVP